MTAGQLAAIIYNDWRFMYHRHNMACSDGRHCTHTAKVILAFIADGKDCTICDGTFTAKRGKYKGYSCQCYTGMEGVPRCD